MSDYGIKVSRDGLGVDSATDKELSMTSKYKTFTVALSGTAQVQLQTGWYRNRVEITHGLGYVPAFQVYGQIDGYGLDWVRVPSTPAAFDIGYYFFYCWMDNQKLYLEVQFGGGSPANDTYNFKYYIFNNRIE